MGVGLNSFGTKASSHWRTVATTILTALVLAATLLSPTVVAIFGSLTGIGDVNFDNILTVLENPLKHGDFFSSLVIVNAFVCGSFIIAFIKLKKGASLRDYLALKPVSVKVLLLWVGAILLFSISVELINRLLGTARIPPSMVLMWENKNSLILLVVALTVAAPLWEEMLFRGFVIRGLQSSVIRSGGAVVVASLVWTLIHDHYEWGFLVVLFLIGLILGAARIHTGSIYVPLAMHTAQNAMALVALSFLPSS